MRTERRQHAEHERAFDFDLHTSGFVAPAEETEEGDAGDSTR
ncbi:hypothetical protein ACIQB5_42025 [Streptomyces sp. NPDC088560]